MNEKNQYGTRNYILKTKTIGIFLQLKEIVQKDCMNHEQYLSIAFDDKPGFESGP